MNIVELIRLKRDGGNLNASQMADLIAGYTAGSIPDYQMSAFVMAAFLNGLSAEEAGALTEAMLHSGEVLDLSDIPGKKVDKHSTGGVGDKVSIILAPIVAACGVSVPMISGRGLGHTGGTLDKLESIPGFNTALSIAEYRNQLGEIGIVMMGQTEEIAPADRKLYALRDVTATVESIPFIAASIMSKKLAEGIDALVLDVKCGSGAFMKTAEDAHQLAERLVSIGEASNTPTVAWLTDMSSPLGHAIGNWPEIVESIDCLQGAAIQDLMEVTYALAAEMIVLGGRAESVDSAHNLAMEAVETGKAFEKFRQMVAAQGGDVSVIDSPEDRLDLSHQEDVSYAGRETVYVNSIDAYALGLAAITLGAGRINKEDEVDPLAGIVLNKKIGDIVHPGDKLATVMASDEERVDQVKNTAGNAFSFVSNAVPGRSRLMNRYSDGVWTHQPGSISV